MLYHQSLFECQNNIFSWFSLILKHDNYVDVPKKAEEKIDDFHDFYEFSKIRENRESLGKFTKTETYVNSLLN